MNLPDRLLGHDDWATTQLLELIQGLTDAQLDQELDIGHRTPRRTFDHMILNVDFWTASMNERPIEYTRDASSVAVMIDDHRRSHDVLADFARGKRDEQRLEDTFGDHFGERMTFGGAILHVILHNAEHRTEALHILGRLGVPGLPEVDHGLWDFKRRGY